jgi:hypothetical protein
MTPHQLQLLHDIADELTDLVTRSDREAVRAILAERQEHMTTLEIIRDWLTSCILGRGRTRDEEKHNRGLIVNVLSRSNGG